MGNAEAITDDLDVVASAAGDKSVGVERAALLCGGDDVNEHEEESEARDERGNVGTHGRLRSGAAADSTSAGGQ